MNSVTPGNRGHCVALETVTADLDSPKQRGTAMTQKHLIVLVTLCALLSACASAPQQSGSNSVLQFYTGAPKPLPDIAILKSTDIPAARRRGNEEIKIELHGINSRRFKGSGGLGDGTFEVHLWPGTYTVYLRYSSVIKTDAGTQELYSHEDQALTLVAAAGHIYMLNGDRLSDVNDSKLSWRPVVLDKTRVVAWRRDEQRAGLAQQRVSH